MPQVLKMEKNTGEMERCRLDKRKAHSHERVTRQTNSSQQQTHGAK